MSGPFVPRRTFPAAATGQPAGAGNRRSRQPFERGTARCAGNPKPAHAGNSKHEARNPKRDRGRGTPQSGVATGGREGGARSGAQSGQSETRFSGNPKSETRNPKRSNGRSEGSRRDAEARSGPLRGKSEARSRGKSQARSTKSETGRGEDTRRVAWLQEDGMFEGGARSAVEVPHELWAPVGGARRFTP
jgi:hypothetical protein